MTKAHKEKMLHVISFSPSMSHKLQEYNIFGQLDGQLFVCIYKIYGSDDLLMDFTLFVFAVLRFIESKSF